MKKWLIGITLFILGIIIFFFALIPQTVTIKNDLAIKSAPGAVLRVLRGDSLWNKWWPGIQLKNNKLTIDNYTFIITKRLFEGVILSTQHENFTDSSILTVSPEKNNSVLIHWQSQINTSNNLFKKLAVYNSINDYKKQKQIVLEKLRDFTENMENIYSVNISQQKVTDTFLLSTSKTFNHYPGTAEIYRLIDKVKKYITAKGIKAVNYPMMHIEKNNDSSFFARVAIPINKEISSSKDIDFKMMVRGNILITGDIKGGANAIAKAFEGIAYYIKDYGKTPPAIPFELLVTDRLQEPDTSEWITRIYYPVF